MLKEKTANSRDKVAQEQGQGDQFSGKVALTAAGLATAIMVGCAYFGIKKSQEDSTPSTTSSNNVQDSKVQQAQLLDKQEKEERNKAFLIDQDELSSLSMSQDKHLSPVDARLAPLQPSAPSLDIVESPPAYSPPKGQTIGSYDYTPHTVQEYPDALTEKQRIESGETISQPNQQQGYQRQDHVRVDKTLHSEMHTHEPYAYVTEDEESSTEGSLHSFDARIDSSSGNLYPVLDTDDDDDVEISREVNDTRLFEADKFEADKLLHQSVSTSEIAKEATLKKNPHR